MKKIFSIAFSLIFVLSTIFSSFVVLAEDESVEVYKYDVKARGLLIALSVFTESQLSEGTESKPVTRGELAGILTKLSLYPEGGNNAVTYDDVSDSHEYFAGISCANTLGLMKGYSDNTFRPDNGVTYAEISTVLIRLLGYESAIPTANYDAYATAMTMKLFQGLKGTRNKDTVVNRADLVTIIFNAIHTDLMELSSYGTNEAYEIAKGCSILTEHFDVYWNKGIIVKNEITALSGISDSNAPDGCVRIDGNDYMVGNTNAADLLGYRVEYYYKVNVNGVSDKQLIYVSEDGLNEILVINSSQLIKPVSDAKTIKYKDMSGHVKTQTIPNTVFFLYNGVPASLTTENVDIDLGEIIFINNGTGSKWSVVRVEACDAVVVEAIDTSKGIVFSKYRDTTPNNGIADGASDFIYEPDDVNRTVFFSDSEGNPIDPQSIAEWDVLHIKCDRSNKRTYVQSLIVEKEGTVTALSGEDTVYLDDIEYIVAPWIINQKPSIMPQLGQTYLFYFDSAGRIAAVREFESNEFSFAYFIDGEVNRTSRTYTIRICEDTGTVVDRDLSSSVKIDGVRKKKPDEQQEALETITGDYISNLIMIKYDSNGLVKEIKTIAGGEFLHQDYDGKYYSAASTLGGKVAIDTSTVHFYIPTDGDVEKYYTRKGTSHLVSDSTYSAKYSKFAYRMADKSKIVAFVNLTVPTDITKDSYYTALHQGDETYMVDDIRYVWDESADMYVTEISAWDKGTMSLLHIRDEDVMKAVSPVINYYSSNNLNEQIFTHYDEFNPPNFKLEKGDIIKVKEDYFGYITRIEIIYDCDKDRMFVQNTSTPYQNNSANYSGYYRMLMGYVNKREDGFFQLACTEGGPSSVPVALDNISQVELMKEKPDVVTVYDSYTEEIYKGNMNDIFTYEVAGENATRTIMEVNRGVVQRIFVYR